MKQSALVRELEKRAGTKTLLAAGGLSAGALLGELAHSILEDKDVVTGRDRQGQALNSLAFMGTGGLAGLIAASRFTRNYGKLKFRLK